MTWNALDLLDEWLTSRPYPPRTAADYRAGVRSWIDTCDADRIAWDKVAAQHIALWAHVPRAPHSATARRVSAVRSYYAHAAARDAIPYNPAARRPRPASPAHLGPASLDPWQIAVLLAAYDERTRPTARHPEQDRACGYLHTGLGLRAGQVMTLTLDDLTTHRNLGGGADTLRLRDPATGHRHIPLPPVIRDAVNAYLPRRVRPKDPTGGGPLFTGRTGARMPHGYPNELLRTVATTSGLLRP